MRIAGARVRRCSVICARHPREDQDDAQDEERQPTSRGSTVETPGAVCTTCSSGSGGIPTERFSSAEV